MLKVEISCEIKRPVEEVFAYATDPAKTPEWKTSVLESSAEPEGPMRVGTQIHTVMRLLGRRLESTAEVTEFVPNRKLVQKANSPFPVEVTCLTEPTSAGTKVTAMAVAEPGGFFKMAEPVLVLIAKKQGHAELATMKALLEAREPARIGD